MLACFENLIDNAARSMPHGGRLDLIMRRRAELDLCEIEIADTGEGMAQEDAQCLLRGEPPRDVPVRNGMGLFLSRLYCESQGGRLEVQTSAGAGTRIRISIPLRPEEMEIAEGASLKPLSAAHPHDGGFAGTTRVRG
jgi:signal transduction histidine kinase